MIGLVERSIELTITLGAVRQSAISAANPAPNFPGTNSNRVRLSGLRTSIVIVKAGGKGLSMAQVRIYGMRDSVMNQISTLGVPIAYFLAQNDIVIEAGDKGSALSTVFEGGIQQAWADLDASPNVAFNIVAYVGLLSTVAPTAATSFTGVADVGVIMSSLATRAGLNFQNNGVTVKLSSPYFSGSLMDQIRACAENSGISYIIDNGTLYIWPYGTSRTGSRPIISPDTGLVGYPRYTSLGIDFTTLYNPSIGYGSEVELVTTLKPALGNWVVKKLTYELESEMPGGRWFTHVEATRPGYAVIR